MPDELTKSEKRLLSILERKGEFLHCVIRSGRRAYLTASGKRVSKIATERLLGAGRLRTINNDLLGLPMQLNQPP